MAGPHIQDCHGGNRSPNFMASVFRSVGLPDTIVSDRDVRFTADLWTSLHSTLGSTLIFGLPHHHNTTSKVERVNGAAP